MPLQLEPYECPYCGEDILVSYVMVEGKPLTMALQKDEVEIVDADGARHRGHERHWKYCTARPTTGSASAEPPDEPPDEPDKVLDE